MLKRIVARLRSSGLAGGETGDAHSGEAGMSTAEYAVGTVAACGFAGLLLKLLTSDQVRSMLSGVISRAFAVVF